MSMVCLSTQKKIITIIKYLHISIKIDEILLPINIEYIKDIANAVKNSPHILKYFPALKKYKILLRATIKKIRYIEYEIQECPPKEISLTISILAICEKINKKNIGTGLFSFSFKLMVTFIILYCP